MCSFSHVKVLRNLLSRNDLCILHQPQVRCISRIKPMKPPDELHRAESNPKAIRLYAWGYAVTGALGFIKIAGDRSKVNFSKRPLRKVFKYSHQIVDVSCGLGYTLYVVDHPAGSKIYGSGLNSDCQIGSQSRRGPDHPLRIIFNTVPIRIPHPLKQEDKFVRVAAGRAHSYALTNTGIIYSFGNNDFGQCGRTIIPNEDYSRFRELWKVKLDSDEHVVDIICGQDHTLFLTKTGKVYSCGNGSDGQTGLGHYNVVSKPTLVQGDIQGENIVKLSSKGDSVLAINDKGDIFGWGNSEYFQIPLQGCDQQISIPRHLPRVQACGKIIDVASSGSKSMILTENKQVFVWGFGILGRGVDCQQSEEPTEIPPTLLGRTAFNPDTTIESIECGLETLAAITNNGELYTWGKNKLGQLGLGHTSDQYYPMNVSLGARCIKICCGVDHAMAMCKSY